MKRCRIIICSIFPQSALCRSDESWPDRQDDSPGWLPIYFATEDGTEIHPKQLKDIVKSHEVRSGGIESKIRELLSVKAFRGWKDGCTLYTN